MDPAKVGRIAYPTERCRRRRSSDSSGPNCPLSGTIIITTFSLRMIEAVTWARDRRGVDLQKLLAGASGRITNPIDYVVGLSDDERSQGGGVCLTSDGTARCGAIPSSRIHPV